MKTILPTLVLTVLGFVAHEAGHALAAQFLGESVTITINRVSPVDGGYDGRGATMLVTLAGPLLTLCLAVAGAVVARSTGSLIAFWLVFTSAFQRAAAQMVSFANPNDEMRVSLDLGIGAWTLPAAMVALLLVLSVWAWRGTKPSFGQFVLGWLGFSAGITVVVFGEPYLPTFTW